MRNWHRQDGDAPHRSRPHSRSIAFPHNASSRGGLRRPKPDTYFRHKKALRILTEGLFYFFPRSLGSMTSPYSSDCGLLKPTSSTRRLRCGIILKHHLLSIRLILDTELQFNKGSPTGYDGGGFGHNWLRKAQDRLGWHLFLPELEKYQGRPSRCRHPLPPSTESSYCFFGRRRSSAAGCLRLQNQ